MGENTLVITRGHSSGGGKQVKAGTAAFSHPFEAELVNS